MRADPTTATWRKSSGSGQNGAYVEIAQVADSAEWRTSSHSGGTGDCVELAAYNVPRHRRVAAVRKTRGPSVIQGWKVVDPAALAKMDIPDHETAVEIPDRLLPLLVEAYETDHG